ncbi:MAG: hypothetical protein WA118_11355 [Carboxydocellales bacterium]
MEQFAFMIHPLDVRDVSRKFKFAKFLPQTLVEGVLPWIPAFKAAEIQGPTSVHSQAKGWFVTCPLTSNQMVSLPEVKVISKIVAAGRVAEQLGAKILGLGAFTSIVGDGGISVAKQLKIPVTTGNSYTIATAITGLKQAASIMGTDVKQARVVIVGATGSIGSVCAELLAREVSNLTLVGREIWKLEKIARKLLYETGLPVHITTDLKKSLPQADIIITVTNSVDVIIEPEHLKSGAIICDVARPRDVSRRVAEVRDDVLVIEGGLVEVPGDIKFNLDFGFPGNTCYGCMAETMLLALEGRYESFSLGKEITVHQVEEIEKIAKKHGFKVAGFRSFERAVTVEEIRSIKERAKAQNNTRNCVNH